MGLKFSSLFKFSSRKSPRPAKLPDSSVSCGGRQDYLKRLGIQKVRNYGTSYKAVIKGSKPGHCASLDCMPPTQHEIKIVASGPSHPSLKSAIRNGSEESCEEHGDMQSALLDLNAQDDFRLSFLRTLSYKKIWVPAVHRAPKHQTVIIFDWDDTLLCTHFLSLWAGSILPSAVDAYLRRIENTSKRLLEKSLQLGQTFIITNAVEGWVEHSARLFVPGLLPVLEKIPIISARSRYKGAYPRNASQWKISAFMELQKQLDLPGVTNLIAVGDSHYEMDAARIMGGEFEQALVKTIKFREDPSSEELAKQLQILEDKFEGVVQMARNLSIYLEQRSK